MAYFLCVIGMVLVIEGIPYIAFPKGMKKMAKQMENIPNKALQITGLIAALLGLGIVYIGTHIGG
jgi:uncharacterized protein YjeT (DUF2065 family)